MNIYSLLDKKFVCSLCGKTHYIPTREVITKKGAISLLPPFLSRLLNKEKTRISKGSTRSPDILILSDDITYEVAGRKCGEILKNTHKTSSLILRPQGTKVVYAEEKYINKILKKARNKDALLSVGTGTITDMGKYAAHKSKIPLISFPTAPSMNGYTSGVAAFLSKGLKITLPVRPARGVLADTDILSASPLDLIKAGFADSLAKSFANADWKISSLISKEFFCPLPLKIVTEAEKKYILKGRDLIQRKEKAISALMDGLHRGGFSMIIAGKSSPASGGEHLISHFLDMDAHKQGREIYAYHGLQVGLGVLISSYIYERLRNFSSRRVERILSSRHIDYDEEIKKLFPQDYGLIRNEFKKKAPLLKKFSKRLPSLWERIKEEAFPLVYPPSKIKQCLNRAKCPLHFRQIGVNKELARKSIIASRYIRSRITILDIADELGILREIAKIAE